MPAEYVIDKELRLVITTAWDRVTFAEARAHQERLRNDPDFHPEFNQLLDATAVTALDISHDEAKTIGRNSPHFSASARRAWVAPNPFLFGMGRMIGIYREMAGGTEQFRVFKDREQALKWLGLDTLPTTANAGPAKGQCIMRERPRKYLVEQSRTVGRQKEARKNY